MKNLIIDSYDPAVVHQRIALQLFVYFLKESESTNIFLILKKSKNNQIKNIFFKKKKAIEEEENKKKRKELRESLTLHLVKLLVRHQQADCAPIWLLRQRAPRDESHNTSIDFELT